MGKKDKYAPQPSITVLGPKLPFTAKECRYVPSSDGTFGVIAFTDGGAFQLNSELNRWEPIPAGSVG